MQEDLRSSEEWRLNELDNLYYNAQTVVPVYGFAGLSLGRSGQKGDDNHFERTDKGSVGSSSNSALFDVGGEGGSDRCEV